MKPLWIRCSLTPQSSTERLTRYEDVPAYLGDVGVVVNAPTPSSLIEWSGVTGGSKIGQLSEDYHCPVICLAFSGPLIPNDMTKLYNKNDIRVETGDLPQAALS